MLILQYSENPTPYFMGRDTAVNLSDNTLKCVVFIGVKERGKFKPRATGFVVGYREDQHGFDHLVTAEHVISGLLSAGHEIWVRANLVGGGSKEFLVPAAEFRFHPDNERHPTDVAVAPFNKEFTDDETGDLIRIDAIPLALLSEGTRAGFVPTPDFERESIVLGGEVAIVGLFRSHHGQNKNIPIVRVGNISAKLSEPVFTTYAGYIDAYLIEARSISGLSGSPVFILPDSSVLLARGLARNWNHETEQSAALLGLMHGHFDVPKLNEDVVTDEGATSGVHTGIGVVIPVQKILETINHPDLVTMRKDIVKALRESKGATSDLALPNAEAVPPANGENPTHREDFMRLVGAAARKPAQED